MSLQKSAFGRILLLQWPFGICSMISSDSWSTCSWLSNSSRTSLSNTTSAFRGHSGGKSNLCATTSSYPTDTLLRYKSRNLTGIVALRPLTPDSPTSPRTAALLDGP